MSSPLDTQRDRCRTLPRWSACAIVYYSPTERYEHIYLNDNFTHGSVWMAWKGLADVDRCHYVQVAEDLYLFVWRENHSHVGAILRIDLQQMRTDGKIMGYQGSDLAPCSVGASAKISTSPPSGTIILRGRKIPGGATACRGYGTVRFGSPDKARAASERADSGAGAVEPRQLLAAKAQRCRAGEAFHLRPGWWRWQSAR